jgi:uncharacterized protein (TIGR02246 family)
VALVSATAAIDLDPHAPAEAFFAAIESAWNAADGERYGARFADVTDFVNIRGEHFSGDGAFIGAAHQGIFDTIYRGSSVRYTVDAARLVAPVVVVAHATSTLDAPSGPLFGTHNSKMTVVLVEEGGSWKATAFHNTLVLT